MVLQTIKPAVFVGFYRLLRFKIFAIRNVKFPENKTRQYGQQPYTKKCEAESIMSFVVNKLLVVFKEF